MTRIPPFRDLLTYVKLARRAIFRRGSEIGLMVCACAVGVAAGLIVSAMSWLSKTLHSVVFGIAHGEWLSSSTLVNKPALLLGPMAGGALLGLVLFVLSRLRTRSIVDPIEANALYGGKLSMTDSVIVAVQNLISNGFGASVGLEAGYTQMSSGIASKLGTKLSLRREDMRILVGCGASGAIAAAFNAPLAGAFYAFELIIGTYSVVALAPVVIAAIVATFVARNFTGETFLIEVGAIGPVGPWDFLPAILLGIGCALIGIVIMKGVSATEQFAHRSSVPVPLRPVLGGLVVGLFAMITPQIMSAGHGSLHLNLSSDTALFPLIILFLLKSGASAISIGSGFRGGLFFASLFMGSLLGKIFAHLLGFAIETGVTPNVFAVIGMSSLAVAIIGGPLTMTFLALEITGDYPITTLVLAAVITSSVVVRHRFGYSFATWRFHLRGEGIRSAHDVGWINTLTVGRMMRADIRTADDSRTVTQLREAFPLGSTQRIILIDKDGRYQGIVLVAELHADERLDAVDRLPAELVHHRDDFLTPSMNAHQAMKVFETAQSEALAVLDNPTSRQVKGQLSESHTLRRYSEEVERHRRATLGDVF
ncbi:MAG: chloride channel protein [Shinella sp.]|nr:MAG: chloride channel protein [Shinella sp.]